MRNLTEYQTPALSVARSVGAGGFSRIGFSPLAQRTEVDASKDEKAAYQ